MNVPREALMELRSRQWSCDTLMRGVSYLDNQRQKVKEESVDIEEQLSVTWILH